MRASQVSCRGAVDAAIWFAGVASARAGGSGRDRDQAAGLVADRDQAAARPRTLREHLR